MLKKIHSHSFGDRVYLRELKKSDINEAYFSWLNDSEVTRFMVNAGCPVSKKEILSYCDKIRKSKNDFLFAIIVKRNKRHIGNARLGPIDWFHRRAEFGIMIGNKRYWGKGYAFEVGKTVLKYAFDTLNLNKINSGIIDGNKRSMALFKKLGFKKEGCVRDNFYINGKYADSIKMGILKKEFMERD